MSSELSAHRLTLVCLAPAPNRARCKGSVGLDTSQWSSAIARCRPNPRSKDRRESVSREVAPPVRNRRGHGVLQRSTAEVGKRSPCRAEGACRPGLPTQERVGHTRLAHSISARRRGIGPERQGSHRRVTSSGVRSSTSHDALSGQFERRTSESFEDAWDEPSCRCLLRRHEIAIVVAPTYKGRFCSGRDTT